MKEGGHGPFTQSLCQHSKGAVAQEALAALSALFILSPLMDNKRGGREDATMCILLTLVQVLVMLKALVGFVLN